MVEEVPMIVTRIPVRPIDEVHIEVEEGNEALATMSLHSIVHVPITRGVTPLGLTTEPQPITMAKAWASQDQGMIERGDGFYYDGEEIRHRRVGTVGQYTFE